MLEIIKNLKFKISFKYFRAKHLKKLDKHVSEKNFEARAITGN